MTIDQKKIKEWYKWGKEAYKSTANMMKNNSHHPDYDTLEKREAVHDKYGDSYMISDKWIARLKEPKWGYADEDIQVAFQSFKDGYNASRKWYKKADAKYQAILDKFMPIFKEAEEVARAVDISDIRDGFPCGSAHLYLDKYPEAEELREAIGHFSTSESEVYKYRLPINTSIHRFQCIAYDERICEKVREFLRTKGIFASIHSWID